MHNNLGADPFGLFGSQRVNNAFGAQMNDDGFGSGFIPAIPAKACEAPVIAQVHMNAAGASAAAWDKDSIVASYKSLVLDVDSLKVAVNKKNASAAKAALKKLKADVDAISKLIK